MPYQIQVKAVERRFNRAKFTLSAVKNIIAVSTAVLPPILSAIGSIPTNKPLIIVISAAGYLGYLSKQVFEYVENNELRENVDQYRNSLNNLIQFYNDRQIHPDDMLTVAATWSDDANGYRLYNPQPEIAPQMFGARASDWKVLISTAIQFVLITAAFIIAVIQESIDGDASPRHWDILLPLILGGLGAMIDPISEHLKKANLIRARDIYQDAIYAFYRPVTVLGNQPLPPLNPPTSATKRRLFEIKKGASELLFIDQTSGHNNTSIEVTLPNNQTPELKVHPNRYRYFNQNQQHAVPNKIVEIVQTDPINHSDPARNPITLNAPDTPLVYRR